MLVVGNQSPVDDTGPALNGFHFTGFDDLDHALLGTLQPDVVLSSLLHDRFDAFDLAERLYDLGFRGRYRVVTEYIDHPDVILREVQSAFPGLDFDILVIDRDLPTPA